jgi:hypothetical protein
VEFSLLIRYAAHAEEDVKQFKYVTVWGNNAGACGPLAVGTASLISFPPIPGSGSYAFLMLFC